MPRLYHSRRARRAAALQRVLLFWGLSLALAGVLLLASVESPWVPARVRGVALDRVLYGALPFELALTGILLLLTALTTVRPSLARPPVQEAMRRLFDVARTLTATLCGLVAGGGVALWLAGAGWEVAVFLVVYGTVGYVVLCELAMGDLRPLVDQRFRASRSARRWIAPLLVASACALLAAAFWAPLPGGGDAQPCQQV